MGIKIAVATATAALASAKAIMEGSVEVAYQTALASTKVAEGLLIAAKASVAPVLETTSQVGQGIVEGAKQTALGAITAADTITDIAEFMTTAVRFTTLKYSGRLSKISKGNLGNVVIGVIIAGKPKTFTIDINLSDGLDGLAKAIGGIVEEIIKIPLEALSRKV